jgi:transposase InsO family protein
MKYQAIRACRNEFPVKRLCQVLQVSRSAYYRWLKRKPGARELEDKHIVKQIKAIFTATRSCYGMPRMRMALRKVGISISRGRVSRLMKLAGCYIKPKKRWTPCTTQADCRHAVQPNYLNRDFKATQPGQKWMGDITYIPTRQGFLYVAAIIDLFSRKIVGLAMADHMQTSLVETAFKMAWHQERPHQLQLHHTDRGAQYTSGDYQSLLKDKVAQVSMSRKGNCWDAAPIESFWGTLKTECASGIFDTLTQARTELFSYVMGFYNSTRLHSALDYVSPCQFEHDYLRSVYCPN